MTREGRDPFHGPTDDGLADLDRVDDVLDDDELTALDRLDAIDALLLDADADEEDRD